jgi:hypothetical protein
MLTLECYRNTREFRHPDESRGLDLLANLVVIPTKAGIQDISLDSRPSLLWGRLCAGTTIG